MATTESAAKSGGGHAKPSGKKAEQARRDAERREKILAAIRSHRDAHHSPLSVVDLAAHVGETPEHLLKLLGQKDLASQVVLAKKTSVASPVALVTDLELLAGSDSLLEFAAAEVRTKREQSGKPLVTKPAGFITDAGLQKPVATPFKSSLEARISSRRLPAAAAQLLLLPPTPAELAAQKAAAVAEKVAKAAAKKAEQDRKRAEKAAAAVAKKAAQKAAEARAKAEIPAKLVAIVRSQVHASDDSYPVSEPRLLELADLDIGEKAIQAALKQPAFTSAVVKCSLPQHPAGTTKAAPYYLLKTDLETPSPRLIARAIVPAIAAKLRAAKKTNVVSATDIAGVLTSDKGAKPRLARGIEALADRGSLSSEIAWVWAHGARLYFRPGEAEPHGLIHGPAAAPAHQPGGGPFPVPAASPAPAATPAASRTVGGEFAAAFEAAFEKVAARTGKRHYLRLLDLRSALPQFSAEEFNAGLRQLRLADRFTLDSSQGGASRLTHEETQAGIQEGSSLLVYVSRK